MVVIQTNAATKKKNTGNTSAIPSTISESFSKHTYPILEERSKTNISGGVRVSISCFASSNSDCASAISV